MQVKMSSPPSILKFPNLGSACNELRDKKKNYYNCEITGAPDKSSL